MSKYTMKVTTSGAPYAVLRGYHGVGLVRKNADGLWYATIDTIDYAPHPDLTIAFEEAAAQASGYPSAEAMRQSRTATREGRRQAKRDYKNQK